MWIFFQAAGGSSRRYWSRPDWNGCFPGMATGCTTTAIISLCGGCHVPLPALLMGGLLLSLRVEGLDYKGLERKLPKDGIWDLEMCPVYWGVLVLEVLIRGVPLHIWTNWWAEWLHLVVTTGRFSYMWPTVHTIMWVRTLSWPGGLTPLDKNSPCLHQVTSTFYCSFCSWRLVHSVSTKFDWRHWSLHHFTLKR